MARAGKPQPIMLDPQSWERGEGSSLAEVFPSSTAAGGNTAGATVAEEGDGSLALLSISLILGWGIGSVSGMRM